MFASCAKKASEEMAEAIDLAQTYLTSQKCDDAIEVLEAAGRTTSDPIYLQVLASAYACRAGYNEVTFLSTEVLKVQSATLMTSLTQLNLSPETIADSRSYQDFRTALNILLYIDANQPSQAARKIKYGPRKSGDLGIQALFLTLNQLGKFIHFYGNVNSAGAKGKGLPNVNEQTSTESRCFVDYTNPQAELAVTGLAGFCTNASAAHPDLSLIPAELARTKKRMCEGLMLVTNIIDILNNVTLPSNPSLGNISTVATSVNALKASIVAVNPALGTLISTTSQSVCESLIANNAEFDNLQLIYVLLFEAGLP